MLNHFTVVFIPLGGIQQRKDIGIYFAKYHMQTEFVIVASDVNCEWSGKPPRYRCYVNDELFTERTWIWKDVYLEEALQIQAQPGMYNIRYELVDVDSAQLNVGNFRIKIGPASVDQMGRITIEESDYENA